MLRFIYMYFFRLGILDGKPGLSLANLMANYEYMISLLYKDKMVRLKEAEKDWIFKDSLTTENIEDSERNKNDCSEIFVVENHPKVAR